MIKDKKRDPVFRKNFTAAARILLALCAFCLILYYFTGYVRPYKMNLIQPLDSGWSLQESAEGEWIALANLSKAVPAEDGGAPVSLRHTLPEQTIEDAALMIVSLHQHIRIYLENTLLFEIPEGTQGENPGAGLYFIPLPEGYEGKALTMRISSPYAIFSKSIQPVFLGDQPSLYTFAMRQSIPLLFLFFFCAGGGLFSIVFSALPLRSHVNRWMNLLFGIFCVMWGLYCISRSYVTYLMFPPLAAAFLRSLGYVLYPIFISAYIHGRFVHYKRPALFAVAGFLVLATLAILSWMGLGIDFYAILPVINPIYQLLFLFLSGLIVLELRRGNIFLKFILPCVIPALITCIPVIFDSRVNTVWYYLYVAAFSFLILMIWIYNLWEFLGSRAKDQEEIRILHMKNALALEYSKSAGEHLEQMQLLRHEMRHHALMLQMLCEEKDMAKISVYLSQISQWEAAKAQVVYSNNLLINCILTSSFAQAARHAIKISHQVMVSEELPISDTDLSSLLMNMLDNAVEACMIVPEGCRWIDIRIQTKDTFLLIMCGNSKIGPTIVKGNSFQSTKPDQGTHGYGVLAMKAIVERYGSMLNIHYDEHSFTVKTMLPLSSGQPAPS